MGCIDDPDISIRLQALDLGGRMVDRGTIVHVVERLLQQLHNSPLMNSNANSHEEPPANLEPAADSDGEDPEEILRPSKEKQNNPPPLSPEYRVIIIRQILDMCSRDTYANIMDFYWYIDVLRQLAALLPPTTERLVRTESSGQDLVTSITHNDNRRDISCAVGWELQNVAVRVNSVRAEAVVAARSLLHPDQNPTLLGSTAVGGEGLLPFAVWILGEYSESRLEAHETLIHMTHPNIRRLSVSTICAYLQAIPKIFVLSVSDREEFWDPELTAMVSLLLARIIDFVEPLSTHPSLEVQERAVELLELMRLACQAVTELGPDTDFGPRLLTKAIPSLFRNSEINPVAPTAQMRIPLPVILDLDKAINDNLVSILQDVRLESSAESETVDFEKLYSQRPTGIAEHSPASDFILAPAADQKSYQDMEQSFSNRELVAKRRAERRMRNKDDPFYIAGEDHGSGASTPFQEILSNANGNVLDVDAIPIMDLELDEALTTHQSAMLGSKPNTRRVRDFHIAADENIEDDSLRDNSEQISYKGSAGIQLDSATSLRVPIKAKKTLLEVDSSGLGRFPFDHDQAEKQQLDLERQEAEDADMAKALKEVENLRLEMQRASERIQAHEGIPVEGTLIKKRKKKKLRPTDQAQKGDDDVAGRSKAALPPSESKAKSKIRKKKKERKTADPENGSKNAVEL